MNLHKPYKDLYIYEIEGAVPDPHHFFTYDLLGHWSEGGLSYLFFSTRRKEELEAFLKRYPGLSFRSETVIDYKDWESGREFKPFRIGPLAVSPVWEEGEGKDDPLPGDLHRAGEHGRHGQHRRDRHRAVGRGTGIDLLDVAARAAGDDVEDSGNHPSRPLPGYR